MTAASAYRPDIQGLRAIAVLLVILFHSRLPVPGGFVGVDVFFVISGFVITSMLLREWEAEGRIDLPRFYARRFRRLVPGLALVVAVTMAVSAFVLSPLGPQQNTAATAFGALLLFANYAIARTTGAYFDLAAGSNALLNTWSLSVEEQFYLLFPVVLLLAFAVRRRTARFRWLPLGAVGVVLLVSLALALIGSAGISIPLVPDGLIGFYGPLTRAWEFAVGAVLALLAGRVGALTRRTSTVLAGLGATGILASAVLVSSAIPFPGPATLVPVLGTALLLQAGASGDNPISRALGNRMLTAIGDRSYALYLWHWPVIVFATALWPAVPVVPLIAAVVAVVPALLAYHFVETPLRHPSPRVPLGRLVGFALVPPLALAGVVAVAVANGYWLEPVQAQQSASRIHAFNAAGCLTWVPITERKIADCTWNEQASGHPVYVVGDSIAEHYAEGLISATAQLDRPLVSLVAPGCAIFHPEYTEEDRAIPTDDSSCDRYRAETLDWLDSAAPGVIVIGQTDLQKWSPRTRDLGKDNRYPQVSPATGAYERGLRDVVERLEAAGHRVVLALAPPSYRAPSEWAHRSCTVIQIAGDGCRQVVPLATIDLLQGGTREAITDVAASSGASVFDPRPLFCDAQECATQKDDVELYLDDIHISVPASELLTPLLVDALDGP